MNITHHPESSRNRDLIRAQRMHAIRPAPPPHPAAAGVTLMTSACSATIGLSPASAATSTNTRSAASGALYLPKPTGPHPVGTTSLYLKDGSRTDPWVPSVKARELVVALWYPATSPTGRRAPYMTPKESELILEDVGIGGVPLVTSPARSPAGPAPCWTTTRDQVVHAAGIITGAPLTWSDASAVLAALLCPRRIGGCPRVAKRAIAEHHTKGKVDRTTCRATPAGDGHTDILNEPKPTPARHLEPEPPPRHPGQPTPARPPEPEPTPPGTLAS
ncbi:hypothetical protein [Actinomadura sp. CNU-125]|uniref:hypothetical protein n=1 Tax=Actinomadura sp. CNU-125 TaxID=1904961 RepID=UPI0011786DB3|nr:hypothetical protein [Actinomadura sp. CNU-125]